MAYHADASDLTSTETLTWEGFGAAQRELSRMVAGSGFKPAIIVAVARGGMPVAGSMTYALGVKLTDVINVEFYTDVHQTLPDPILLAPMMDTEAIAGRKILVVDDVVDSGRTLNLVIRLLRGFGAEVRSAVLYAKSGTLVEPDYVWKQTDEWIVFPWSAEPPVTAEAPD